MQEVEFFHTLPGQISSNEQSQPVSISHFAFRPMLTRLKRIYRISRIILKWNDETYVGYSVFVLRALKRSSPPPPSGSIV